MLIFFFFFDALHTIKSKYNYRKIEKIKYIYIYEINSINNKTKKYRSEVKIK